MEHFTPLTAQAVESLVEDLQNQRWVGPLAAVFDADGTLWSGDIGDDFFRWQLRQAPPKGAPEKAWEVYQSALAAGRAAEAYGWLATWCAGETYDSLEARATEYFRANHRRRIFAPMRDLIERLHASNVSCWIVSASPHWSVAAGAAELGIAKENILAASPALDNGVAQPRLAYPVPYRDQKRVLVETHIKGTVCLAAGNTYWDKELLHTSRGLALAVRSEGPGAPGFEAEQNLEEYVRERRRVDKAVVWVSERFKTWPS